MKPDMEEVLRMAREAGIVPQTEGQWVGTAGAIVRFYALAYEAGARAEREECAKVCEKWVDIYIVGAPHGMAFQCCADDIRARTT